MASSVKTRKDTELWIIGHPINIICNKKLSSNGDVLRRLFYITINEKETLKKASNIVCEEICQIWNTASIPTKSKPNIVTKIIKIHNQYRSLQKSRTKRNKSQIEKETTFKDRLNDIFDIAHMNALDMISNEEDKRFLEAQREKGRRGYMTDVDKEMAAREDRKRKRGERNESLKLAEKLRKETASELVEITSSTSSSSESEYETAVEATSEVNTPTSIKQKRTKIISPDLVAALDRTKTSDRNAVMVVASTATSLGFDVNDVVISRSTLQRERKVLRKKIAEDIKQSFSVGTPLTVHWDGKIMEDLTGNEKTERLPILVSGDGNSKLLAVPKLTSGKGGEVAKAVVESLYDWNLQENVQAMCFDTTASNTGNKQGACIGIETMLERRLLSLACRHHINEIIISDVFNKCHNLSTGPDILLFKRFQNSWDTIDKEKYESHQNNLPDKESIVKFCKEQLEKSHSRADYRELLEITIIYLGDTPARGVHFRRPGALHRARWMARVLYSIKIVLFKTQFKMTKKEQSGMERFARYAVLFYVQNWFSAPFATTAPRTDLEYLQQLQKYDDKELSTAASKALCRHLWYLNEELVSLAFFDSDVSTEMKREMIDSLKKIGPEIPDKRIALDFQDTSIPEKTLANFVTNNSRSFFEKLSLSSTFLEFDPSEWNDNDDYKKAKEYVSKMNVVNDNAERAVALMQSFNTHLTKNEEQMQYILQIVEKHREEQPTPSKSVIKHCNKTSN